jgi:hypothetical protein
MASKKEPTWLDGILGSQLRDTQGEMLSVEGADISELEAGRGRWNDNHAKGAYNVLGHITEAKKIFGPEDCENERHKYYWEKIKAPYIYGKGYLYDDEDHPNARAAAAILRSVHKHDAPLKLKLSVEGGVVARGVKDPNLLARTKIHSCAITFTPANQATLCEPVNMTKTASSASDEALIKSVMHLAESDVPSFRHVTRHAQATVVSEKIQQINALLKSYDIEPLPQSSIEELIKDAVAKKVFDNVQKITEMVKMLSAGYGGAGAPTGRTHGAVLQTEALDDGRKGFQYYTCFQCGDEQVYSKNQMKCRKCGQSLSFEDLFKLLSRKK